MIEEENDSFVLKEDTRSLNNSFTIKNEVKNKDKNHFVFFFALVCFLAVFLAYFLKK